MERSYDGKIIVFNSGSSTKRNKGIPSEILEIADYWFSLSKDVGDKGSCVVGAKMTFCYKLEEYKMFPQSPYQGEQSWTKNVYLIESLLEEMGAEDIMWHYGSLD